MIDTKKIIALSKSENWKETKKALRQKQRDIAVELLYIDDAQKYEQRKYTARAYKNVIDFIESFAKSEQIQKNNSQKLESLWEIPESL